MPDTVYSYGGRGADPWWAQNGAALERLRNRTVIELRYASSGPLVRLASRSMDLQFTIQDGHVWITDGADTAGIEQFLRQAPSGART